MLSSLVSGREHGAFVVPPNFSGIISALCLCAFTPARGDARGLSSGRRGPGNFQRVFPSLWSAAVIFIPPLATVMLFVFTMKDRRVLTEKFFPPIEDPRAEDGETPPPAQPPIPELYQL